MEFKILTILIVGIVVAGGAGFGGAFTHYSPHINKLQDELNDLDSQNEKLSGQYEALLQEHDVLAKQYDSTSEQYNGLLDQYDTLFKEHNDLSKQYDENQTSYDSLLSKYERIVGSLPLSPEPISTETTEREYEWRYGGYTWTLTLSIPDSLYEYYKNLDRPPISDYSVYVTHPYDDEYIKTIIEKFNFIAIDKKYTEEEKINLVISFVQSLPYTSDEVTTPYDEYPRYPLETLVDQGGDCEDTSILVAAFLDKLNYDVILLGFPDHMAAGVSIDTYGYYWTFNDKDYFYLETTSKGWEIGEIPPEFSAYEYADTYPLNPVPIFTHDWEAIQEGFKMKITITIENVGSALAKGIRAYAAFDAGEGYVWHQEESEPFDLHFGRDVTKKLVLDVPRNEYTRLIVGILDSEGYLIDVSYSEWFNTS